jgi:hypothetical protein
VSGKPHLGRLHEHKLRQENPMSAWTERADRHISGQLGAYRHALASASRKVIGDSRCPRCGMVMTSWLEQQHCPRCLARRVGEELGRFSPER